MERHFKYKKILIMISVLIIIIGVILVWFFLFRGKPSSDPDKLWPEQGEVIAVIEGKEYRYDPIYLYRLTNYCFSEDPNKPVTDLFGIHGVGFSPVGVFFGKTQAEAAVCLELTYKEGKEIYKDKPIEESVILAHAGELGYEYEYTKSDEYNGRHKDEIIARHESAKFVASQSDQEYLEYLHPYIEKFTYIDQTVFDPSPVPTWDMEMCGLEQDRYYELLSTTGGRRTICALIGENLLKKYNVEMVE